MNLRQLETFLWVATLGSFRKTAERLFTTQPAISARIATLEEALGAKLFERDGGSIRLTAMGLELLPYAEKVLRITETMRERAGAATSAAGILRLGVSETVVHAWFPDFLARLHEAYPAVDVEITVDVTVNLRAELVARSLDLAFLLGPISEYTITNLDLCSFPLVWAASPTLGFQALRPVESRDLARHPILTYARNTRPFAEIDSHFRETVEEPARIFPSSSLAACLRMTYDGIGVGTLPKAIIAESLESGRLVEVTSDWLPSALNFTACYPTEPYRPIVGRAAELAQEVAAADDRPG